MPKCHGYKCNCTSERIAIKGGASRADICECNHAIPHKGGVSARQTRNQEELEELPREEKPASRKRKARKVGRKGAKVSASKTGLTPAEARAKLRAAGIPVGQRGRLSPEQMAQAVKL